MAGSLGSLVVSLAADTARFEGDLGRAAAIAESRMRNIKDSATRALGALTVVASAASAALVAGLKQAIDRADDMRDLAAASGVTVEQLSRLEFAGKRSGVELEKIGKALTKLAVGGAVDANAELLSLADQFKAMPDGAAKTAKAVEIFGERLGPGLIPLLNEGRDGLLAFADASDRLGLTISKATAEAADQFNERLTDIADISRGAGQIMSAELLPVLNGLVGAFVESAKNSDILTRASRALGTGLRLLVDIGFSVYSTLENIGTSLGAVAAAAVQFATGNFRQAWQIIKDANADGLARYAEQNAFLEKLWDDTGAKIESRAPETGRQIASPVVEAAKVVREQSFNIGRETQNLLAQISRETAVDVAADVKRNYDGTFYTLEVRAQETTESISTFAEQGARNMQSAFADFLFDPFQDGLKGMLRSFIDVIRRMVAEQAAAKLLGSKESGGFGFGDVVTGAISSFFGGFKAGGGPVSGGKAYVVGEQGPELFMPGRSGTIVPNGAIGSTTLAPVINIDARGATVDAVKLLPAAMEQAANMAVARMQDMLSRRAMR